jgi:hypothetical protein
MSELAGGNLGDETLPKLSITIMSLPQTSVLAAVRTSEVDFAFN